MKIVGWTWCDNPDYPEMFPIGEPARCDWDMCEVEQEIAAELRRCGYKFTGAYHQNGDFGVPIFDNGMTCVFTQRTWGHIMAMAYPDQIDNSDNMGYVQWAWLAPEEMVVPDFDGNKG